MKIFHQKNNKGYTLMEFLFYISIFIIISLVIIESIIVMVSSYRKIALNNDLIQSAQIIETISREIKDADTVNMNLLISNILELTSQTSLGDTRLVQIVLLNGNVEFYEKINNGVLVKIGNLNSLNTKALSLIFVASVPSLANPPPFESMSRTAVSIGLTVETNRFGSSKTIDFYNTITPRKFYYDY